MGFTAVTKVLKVGLKIKSLVEKQCSTGAKAELKALGEWFAKNCSSKQALVDAASANSHLHSEEIFTHVQELWVYMYGPAGFSPSNFDKLGKAIADVSYWAIGPVTPMTDF